MSKSATGMIPFSLAEMMLLPKRPIRTVMLREDRFLMWTPKFFTKYPLRINLNALFGVGLFDTDTEWLVKELRTMERPVQISSWGVFSLYHFGEAEKV